ncbi:MAG TPA: hypothetical protein VGE66_09955 [Chitinophagaceae bacterium]
MERIQVLIEKLAEQSRRGESPAQLLFTVQLLQQELVNAQQSARGAGSSKVAVVMPSRPTVHETRPAIERPQPRQEEPFVPKPEPAPVQEPEREVYELQLPVDAMEPEEEEKTEEEPKREEYILRKPFVEEPATKEEERKTAPHPQAFLPFDAAEETPTLMRHNSEKDLNEVIGEQKESLNDRLKQEKTEVAHVLKDTPIKDLRKGIGINDKFLFVNELFRGDEAMYERSIKTINGFHILPEAEYWINRELKFKLGWNDNKDTVQHFYHLVRRRFS